MISLSSAGKAKCLWQKWVWANTLSAALAAIVATRWLNLDSFSVLQSIPLLDREPARVLAALGVVIPAVSFAQGLVLSSKMAGALSWGLGSSLCSGVLILLAPYLIVLTFFSGYTAVLLVLLLGLILGIVWQFSYALRFILPLLLCLLLLVLFKVTAPINLLLLTGFGLLSGAVTGVAQFYVSGGRLPACLPWVLASSFGCGYGLASGVATLGLISILPLGWAKMSGSTHFFLTILVSSFSNSVITGLALQRSLHRAA
uniref:Uncharacterized protein n=1 Tax=Cyanothece sp. (strain PCC 7425 / ATCC 29141) TaxID=395961 RepID=B8HUD6_CYAP4